LASALSLHPLIPAAALASAALLSALAARRDLGAPFLHAIFGVSAGAGLLAFGFRALGIPQLDAIALALLAVACVLIAEIDRRHRLIPDTLTAAVALIGAVAPFALPWPDGLAAATLLGGLFLAVRFGFSSAGRHDALGMGDVKLAGAMGLVLGVQDGLIAVAVSAAGTALVAISIHSLRKVREAPPPAPFGIGLATCLGLMAAFRT
jgi:leader peptidase (prepilin peptidase) / N-methyltransferase